jgi:hypothetical protein
MEMPTPPSQHPRLAAFGRPESAIKASVDRRLISDAQVRIEKPGSLAEKAKRLRKQAQGTPPGIERERLVRRARQLETASRMNEWLTSRGLQAPKQGQ